VVLLFGGAVGVELVQTIIVLLLVVNLVVNLVVLYEYRQARAERLRRKRDEINGAFYDAQAVHNARYVMNALETFEECFPCREAIERGLDKRLARDRLWP
jgi:hypothetical protein